MKPLRVRLVESSVERTARMLSSQYNIRVIWKGSECKTDGRVIYLPVLPYDAPDELLEAVQGFLDHETAHIIFTDFSPLQELSQEQFHCVNVCEDLRIEKRMEALFPGSAYNLKRCHEWIYSKIEEHWDHLNQFRKACAAFFHWHKFGQDTHFYNSVVDPITKQILARCIAHVGPLNLETTLDAKDAGLRLYEALADEAAEERKAREEQEGSGNVGLVITDAEGNEIVTSINDLGKIISQLAASFQTSKGYQHGQETPGYLPYTTEHDTVKFFPVGDKTYAQTMLQHLREHSLPYTAVIKQRLVNSLRTSLRRRWLSGQESGRIDSRKLHHVVLGTGNNVYKTLTNKQTLDTVVMMAIDHSGSMSGKRLELAGQAAITLGDALHALRIPFAVYGYSTDAPKDVPRNTALYSRWAAHWIRYYHQFDDAWQANAHRLAQAKENAHGNTLDSESVLYGIRQLQLRKESRKILLVLNDGMPNPGFGHIGQCQNHLHEVVRMAAKAGVEVVAFGIQSDAVAKYYPKHVVIQKLEDLVAAPLNMLDKMLRESK